LSSNSTPTSIPTTTITTNLNLPHNIIMRIAWKQSNIESWIAWSCSYHLATSLDKEDLLGIFVAVL
jgi:hypothetical protein